MQRFSWLYKRMIGRSHNRRLAAQSRTLVFGLSSMFLNAARFSASPRPSPTTLGWNLRRWSRPM